MNNENKGKLRRPNVMQNKNVNDFRSDINDLQHNIDRLERKLCILLINI
jgi:ubiquinone biosynthesis protein UbiJ